MTNKFVNRNKAAVVILLALLVLAAGVTAFQSCSAKKHIAESEPPELHFVYDENAVSGGWEEADPEKIVSSLNDKVEKGMINISMNTAQVFSDGASAGNLLIVNEEINNYPQVVTITRNDTGETIYTSGAIPVGSKIEQAKLDADLPAGTYECTAIFHNIDPETGENLGSAGAVITINVLA